MKKFILRTQEEVEDFITGITFHGTGGGGSPQRGIDLLMDQIRKGNEPGWSDPSELQDEQYSCCPFLMGSIADPDEETKKEMREIYHLDDPDVDETEQMIRAVTELQEKTGKKISALVPVELGGGNAAACISAAAEMGILLLDGDYSGRAVPEIGQTTPFVLDQNLLPIVACDGWGNIAVIEKAISWRMAERMGKQLAVAGYAHSSQAGFCNDGKATKEAILGGSLTRCYEVGKFIREAAIREEDPTDSIAEKVGGWVVCKGTVTKKDVEDKDDYYWATHEITGVGDYADTNIKIWMKNENHVCWRNGEVLASSPDLIQVVDRKTGKPYTNNSIRVGMEVAVIVMKAKEIFRTERGLSALGPKAFGFQFDYIPVEERINS